MLALSLKRNCSVKIGDRITIYNKEPRQVDIVIDAPRDVKIVRVNAENTTFTK